MDSVSTNGNYFNINIKGASLKFYNHAPLNFSWTVKASPYAVLIDSIKFTCTSLGIENIFGTLDSVKNFSLVAYNNGSVISQFSNFHYKLSKSFGFVEFVPFRNILEDDYWYSFEGITKLVLQRMENGGQVYGFSFPKFSAYFHPNNNDIKKWHYVFTPEYVWGNPFHQYIRDSIYKVIITDDSVCSTVYSTFKTFTEGSTDTSYYYSTYSGCIYKKDFDPFLVNGKGEMIIHNNPMGYVNGTNGVMVWGFNDPNSYSDTTGNLVQIDSSNGGASFIVRGYDFGYWLDTIDCMLNFSPDDVEQFTMDTIVGIRCTYSWMNGGSIQNCLIGYILGTDTSGDWLPLGIHSISENSVSDFQVKPTLAKNFIQLTVPTSQEYQALIFSIHGEMMFESSILSGGMIDVGQLPQGIYFIRVQSKTKYAVMKFIKQ